MFGQILKGYHGIERSFDFSYFCNRLTELHSVINQAGFHLLARDMIDCLDRPTSLGCDFQLIFIRYI